MQQIWDVWDQLKIIYPETEYFIKLFVLICTQLGVGGRVRGFVPLRAAYSAMTSSWG
jgi:hypothetical protein